MKKITLILALLIASFSSYGQQGPFLYQVEANWLAECDAQTPLTTEDFEGATITGGAACGAILSSESSTCFPIGELEDGFTITASDGGNTFVGTPGQVGANQDVTVVGVVGGQGESTVVTFTEPVTRIALDIFGISSSPGEGIIRVFDTNDTLLETFDIDVTIGDFNFFGIHSSDLIGKIELEDPDDGEGLIFGNLRFGHCSINDDPDTAIALTVGDVFEDAPITSNNNFASDSQLVDPTIPAPSCASYNGGDVWFSAVVPESGSITVETQFSENSALGDSGIALYTENLTEVLDCDDDDGNGLFSLISLTDRTPGEIVLVRVWEFGGDSFGELMVSAYDFSPPPNDLIENAIDVDEIGFPYTDSAINMEDATEDIVNGSGCDAALNSVVWYKFTAFADGTVTATFENPTDNTDSLIVFYSAENENATNDDLTFVASGSNVCANANNHTDISIEAVAGQSYYILVNSLITSTIIVDSETVLSTEENTIEGFSFYPNPVQDVINIQSVQTVDQVVLYNITGQKVLDQKINATNAQLSLGDLTTGVYLMTATSGNVRSTYKVIKK